MKKLYDYIKQIFQNMKKNYKLKLQEIYDAMPGQLDQKNKRFQLKCN